MQISVRKSRIIAYVLLLLAVPGAIITNITQPTVVTSQLQARLSQPPLNSAAAAAVVTPTSPAVQVQEQPPEQLRYLLQREKEPQSSGQVVQGSVNVQTTAARVWVPGENLNAKNWAMNAWKWDTRIIQNIDYILKRNTSYKKSLTHAFHLTNSVTN